MKHRTSPQQARIEAEVQARRQAAYDAMRVNFPEVSEADEPRVCGCGKHYVAEGLTCP